MELMGFLTHCYSMEEDDIVTDYDYLPSDSCTISITLKELQEKLQLQMLYTKVSSHTAGADKNAPKLAVVFPGIGYTADKPLLYYTSRLASKHGYKIRTVSYDNLPENVKGDPEKMKQAFDLALEQTERSLSSIEWNSYGSILFISKSIGTVISSAYASRHDLTVKASCLHLLQRPFPSHLPEALPSTAPQIPGPKPIPSRNWQRRKMYLSFSPKTPTILWKPVMY